MPILKMKEDKSKEPKQEEKAPYAKLTREMEDKKRKIGLLDSEIASLEAELERCRSVYGIPVNPLKLIKKIRLSNLYEQRRRKELGFGALKQSAYLSLISRIGGT